MSSPYSTFAHLAAEKRELYREILAVFGDAKSRFTDGNPSGAVQTLLRELTACGAKLRFHTDFDVGGVRIGNLLVDRYGAKPWGMGVADYEQAAQLGGAPLAGTPDPALWDQDLAPAIGKHGLAVHEEQVIESLLADLTRTQGA